MSLQEMRKESVCSKPGRWCDLTSDLPVSAVLAAGVPADGPGHDPGRLLRSDPPTLPQQAVEAAALPYLLLRGRIRPHPHHPLDLPHRGLLLRAGAGERAQCGHKNLKHCFDSVKIFCSTFSGKSVSERFRKVTPANRQHACVFYDRLCFI